MTEDGGRKTRDGGRKTGDKGRRTGDLTRVGFSSSRPGYRIKASQGKGLMVNQSGQDHCDPSPETTERTGLPGATLVQASGDMGNGKALQTAGVLSQSQAPPLRRPPTQHPVQQGEKTCADFHFWACPAGFGLFLPVPFAQAWKRIPLPNRRGGVAKQGKIC